MTSPTTPSLARSLAFLRAYLGPRWPRVTLLAALLLLSTGAYLAGPQVLRVFIDTALAGGPAESLLRTALLFLAVSVLDSLLWIATHYVGEDVGWRATNALRADLARHCLDLDLGFHNRHTPGELIERIDGDVTALAGFFSRFVILVLGSVLALVGVLALLFREDWRVGLAMSLFVGVAAIALHRLRRFAFPYFAAGRQASAEVYGYLEERLAGVPDIHASGAQPYVLRRFHEQLHRRYRRDLSASLAGATVFRTADGLFMLSYILALGVGAVLFGAGDISLGAVYLIFQYTEYLRFPLEQLAQQLQEFQKASAAVGRVEQLLAIRSQVTDGPGAALPAGPPAVGFDGVTFAYPLRAEPGEPAGQVEAALRDVTFAVEPGQVLGVLGRTGSGKTTLSRLLFRFYDPDAGTIRLGGHDLRQLGLDQLRHTVGLVTQEVQLFQATVRDNLTLFDRRMPEARITRVLDELGLERWRRSLPAGLDTVLDAGGKGLSAGQAQLLALARVFLRDPGVVILDEASSRLDPATERLLEQAIDRVLLGRTGIIIAHRLATVRRADTILILEGGHVRECGPRRVLEAAPTSRFSRLLRTGLEAMDGSEAALAEPGVVIAVSALDGAGAATAAGVAAGDRP